MTAACQVHFKGRLRPGKMLLVDFAEVRFGGFETGGCQPCVDPILVQDRGAKGAEPPRFSSKCLEHFFEIPFGITRHHVALHQISLHALHIPRESNDQTLPIGSREPFIWTIPKTILCLVLDFQGVYTYLLFAPPDDQFRAGMDPQQNTIHVKKMITGAGQLKTSSEAGVRGTDPFPTHKNIH